MNEPKHRQVRREFNQKSNGDLRTVILREGRIGVHKGGDLHFASTVALEDAPEVARLMLEIYQEATRPDPPECPYCGGETETFGNKGIPQGFWASCQTVGCMASGPIRLDPAEALAAFTRIRKGEG